jgi:hypothetical protein
MKVLMHALAASCEELRARTGNTPLDCSEDVVIVNNETFTFIMFGFKDICCPLFLKRLSLL